MSMVNNAMLAALGGKFEDNEPNELVIECRDQLVPDMTKLTVVFKGGSYKAFKEHYAKIFKKAEMKWNYGDKAWSNGSSTTIMSFDKRATVLSIEDVEGTVIDAFIKISDIIVSNGVTDISYSHPMIEYVENSRAIELEDVLTKINMIAVLERESMSEYWKDKPDSTAKVTRQHVLLLVALVRRALLARHLNYNMTTCIARLHRHSLVR